MECSKLKVCFDLPASFDPGEFLPGRLLLHSDAARWLMSTVLRKIASHHVDVWGCVRLDSMILRRVMGSRSTDIARALEAGGAIETASYRAGVRCKGYRLAHRYLGDRCVRRQDVGLVVRFGFVLRTTSGGRDANGARLGG